MTHRGQEGPEMQAVGKAEVRGATSFPPSGVTLGANGLSPAGHKCPVQQLG